MQDILRVDIGLTAFLTWCLMSLPAHASVSPEQNCRAARYTAAGTYAKCRANAQAKREKTTPNGADPHDADNTYTSCADGNTTKSGPSTSTCGPYAAACDLRGVAWHGRGLPPARSDF